MKVQIKSPRANKRKIVVPFSGEENFIVPKQGGFGQPDNEEWISVESQYANLIDTSSPAPSPTDTKFLVCGSKYIMISQAVGKLIFLNEMSAVILPPPKYWSQIKFAIAAPFCPLSYS